MDERDFKGLKVKNVRSKDETKMKDDGEIEESVVYTTVLTGTGLRITLTRPDEAFPWRVGDPIDIRITSPQTHLDVDKE